MLISQSDNGSGFFAYAETSSQPTLCNGIADLPIAPAKRCQFVGTSRRRAGDSRSWRGHGACTASAEEGQHR
jgi:hypothetical protein